MTAGSEVSQRWLAGEVVDIAGGPEEPAAVVVAAEHAPAEAIVREGGCPRGRSTLSFCTESSSKPRPGFLGFLLAGRQVRVCSRDDLLLDRVEAVREEPRR